MKNEFIPYEQALALKELGFDGGCIAWYRQGKNNVLSLSQSAPLNWHTTNDYKLIPSGYKTDDKEVIPAPLYQQAFRWFREEHNLFAEICLWGDEIGYTATIKREAMPDVFELAGNMCYKTYEEAQDACLRKLIEIVKEKQDENN